MVVLLASLNMMFVILAGGNLSRKVYDAAYVLFMV